MPESVTPIGQEPRLPRLYLHNDHPNAWSDDLRLELIDFSGSVIESEQAAFRLEPGGSLRFIVPGDWAGGPDRLVRASCGEAGPATWFFARDKDLPYPPPRLDLAVEPDGADLAVTITAQSLVRDLCLFPERLDPAARVSDQLITLLPGESTRLRISGGRRLSPEELWTPGVLWSVNPFGALRF